MELYTIKEDIPTLFVSARSFPDGVMEAWRQLHEKIPASGQRRFFGISWENKDHIIQYLAAAEKLNGENGVQSHFESFVIPKGSYRSHWIRNYNRDYTEFSRVFTELLRDPALDPNGFCLEIYDGSEDALCLVKLDSVKVT